VKKQYLITAAGVVILAVVVWKWTQPEAPVEQVPAPSVALEVTAPPRPLSEAPTALPELLKPSPTAVAQAEIAPSTAAARVEPEVRRGPYRIYGTVINLAQSPIESATVICERIERGLLGPPKQQIVLTDEGGQFELFYRQPGAFDVLARKEGFARGSAAVELTMPGSEEVNMILRPGGIIYGKVQENLTGIPLAGASVWASAWRRLYAEQEMRPQRRVEAKTASDGSYLLNELLPDQPYLLVVTDGQHAPELRQGVKPDGPPVDFFLNPSARVSGRVIWEGDGSPVEGAMVTLGFGFGGGPGRDFMRRMFPVQLDSATTDANGLFTLIGLPSDRRVPLIASYQESQSLVYRSRPEWLELQGGQEKTGLELAIERRPPQRLHGVVRDIDRHPVQGALVTAQMGWGRGFGGRPGQGPGRAMMRRMPSMPVGEATTNTNGEYEILLSFPGPQQVDVEMQGFYARPEGTNPVMVRPGVEEYRLDFVLFPSSSLGGKVREADGDKPIPGVTLRLRKQEGEQEREGQSRQARWFRPPASIEETESGPDGRYLFEGLAPGEYSIRVTDAPEDYVLPEKADPVTLEEEKATTHDIELDAGVSISGQVLYPDGRMASGARITGFIIEGEDGGRLSDESDPLGRYELSAFPADTSVRILVRPLDFPELNPAPLLTDPIPLRTSLTDYDLRVPEEGKVRILVLSEEQKPLRGQRVEITIQDLALFEEEGGRQFERTFTKERTTRTGGLAEFTELTPSTWTVSIETRKEPVQAEFQVYEAETAELTMTIPTESLVDNSGVLIGKVRYEDETPAERVRVTATLQEEDEGVEAGTRGSTWTDSEGQFRMQGLRRDKTFTVEVRSRRAAEKYEGIVTPQRELEFILPNSGALSVRVVDARGDVPASPWNAYLFRLEEGRTTTVRAPADVLAGAGIASWEGLSQGTYQVLIAGDETPRAYGEPVEVFSDELTDGVEVQLPNSVDFSGGAIDADTEKGIPGVEVLELFEEGTPGARWPQYLHQRKTYTDSTGDFILIALPPGPVRLRLSHPSYETFEYEGDGSASGETEIFLQKIAEEEK